MKINNWNVLTFAILIVATITFGSVMGVHAMSNKELDHKLVEVQDCIYINSYLHEMPPSQATAYPINVKIINDYVAKGFRPATDQYEIHWMLSHRCVDIEQKTRQNKTIYILDDEGTCPLNQTRYYSDMKKISKCYYELPEKTCRVSKCDNSGWKKRLEYYNLKCEPRKVCIKIFRNSEPTCFNLPKCEWVKEEHTEQEWCSIAQGLGLNATCEQVTDCINNDCLNKTGA